MQKENTMLRLPSDLKESAREAGLNLSQLLEQAIRERLKAPGPPRVLVLREGKNVIARIEVPDRIGEA